MLSQRNINANTPNGTTVFPDGVAFKLFAPSASLVYLNGTFGGVVYDGRAVNMELLKNNNYWTGFMPGAGEGDRYRFWVVGPAGGTEGYKRDPYSRELLEIAPNDNFPRCFSVIRGSDGYPWHDAGFRTPDFSDMIIYQIHVGTYSIRANGVESNFLDVALKVPYLAALNINVLQPLPIDEQMQNPGMGYGGADLFSPDFPYVVPPARLDGYVGALNQLLQDRGHPANLSVANLTAAPNQLKALVDICHVYGIAVNFDVVYNHGGGFDGDGFGLYFLDRQDPGAPWDNNRSLYFTDQDRGTGGLAFALWNADVCKFLVDNAVYFIDAFHADGFRYDEISILLSCGLESGWAFCGDLSTQLRQRANRILQNAEFWPSSQSNVPDGWEPIYRSADHGGCGFDVVQHDKLRIAVRTAITSASFGMQSLVKMSDIADVLYPPGLDHAWRAVVCVENHDIVKRGKDQRIPRLADSQNQRTWYATSRSRFATALLLTAPGIPQIFMGQEFLQDNQWDVIPDINSIYVPYWPGVNGGDKAMVNHLRFTQDAARVRNTYPALRSDRINVYHSDDQTRVIAFHRWIDGIGGDVVVVGSLSDFTWWDYSIGFPSGGYWREVFNSDVYENWVNPLVAGNGGGIDVSGPPMHGFQTSSSVVIPANSVVVFVKA